MPGHGALVDRDFVEEQRDAIAIVAQTIRDLAASGVPADRALAEGEWPFPREGLVNAVALGYAALPPGRPRGLPAGLRRTARTSHPSGCDASGPSAA